MFHFQRTTAVITGASQGIGQAIAAALHEAGATLVLLGRDRTRLEAATAHLATSAPPPTLIEADLSDATRIADVAEQLSNELRTIDVLINCGGAYLRSPWHEPDAATFTELLKTNVVGPYILTKFLLPRLVETNGDIVFVNSSITRSTGLGASHFKASEHALQGLADSLRTEINEKGIRVLSIYPGRTATPRQKAIYAEEGRPYRPDMLLQPSDVAASVLFCLSLPKTAEVTDLYIRQRLKG